MSCLKPVKKETEESKCPNKSHGPNKETILSPSTGGVFRGMNNFLQQEGACPKAAPLRTFDDAGTSSRQLSLFVSLLLGSQFS